MLKIFFSTFLAFGVLVINAQNNANIITLEEIIKKNNYKTSELIKLAEMKKSYNVELSKGMKLSKFVTIKK